MELQNISMLSMVGMAFSAIISIGLPVTFVVYMVKKQRANLSVFFVGCLTFIISVLVLETIVGSVLMNIWQLDSEKNILLYAVYGGIKAALFEETARWIVMRYPLKKKICMKNAVMYGIGHGGIEAIALVGLPSISNLVTSVMINKGVLEQNLSTLDDSLYQQTLTAVSALWTTKSSQFFLLGVERIPAIAFHILLSIWVYLMIKEGKKRYLISAYFLHFLIDFGVVVLAAYCPVWMVEIVLTVCVLALGCFTVHIVQRIKGQ